MSITKTDVCGMLQSMTIFDRVKTSCANVCRRAKHVEIYDYNIQNLSDQLPRSANRHMNGGYQDPARTFRKNVKDTIEFVCFLNAANFGSGYEKDLLKEKSISSETHFYAALTGALNLFVQDHGLPNCHTLMNADIDLYARMFGLSLNHTHARELLSLYQKSYQGYASYLDSHFDRDVYNLYQQSDGSARQFIENLAAIPSYNDVAEYKSEPVYFYKRAQITAADLFFALEGYHEAFVDINQLTAFADPALSQMLHYFGVLDYRPQLADKINSHIMLDPGSEEEIEIRAATIHAIEKIKGYYPFWRVIDIDDILWRLSVSLNLSHVPRHYTKTIFY